MGEHETKVKKKPNERKIGKQELTLPQLLDLRKNN